MTDITLYNVPVEFFILYSSFLPLSFSSAVHSHYLYGHMLAAFWEWYAKSGKVVQGATKEGGRGCDLQPPFLSPGPHLPPFTSHLSFGHVQYRGQLWPLNFRECPSVALAAVKGDSSPSLPSLPPVLPVALLLSVLCSCSPGLLVSAVGFSSWF